MYSVSDNVNSFILEYKKMSSEFDRSVFVSDLKYYSEGFKNAPISEIIMKADIYSNFIDKSLNDMKDNINNDSIDELLIFYTNLNKSTYLNDKDITLMLEPINEVQLIRPDHIFAISHDFQKIVTSVLSGKIKMKDIKSRYLDDTYLNTLKAKVVKTTLTTNSIKDLLVVKPCSPVNVDNDFVVKSIIPSIRNTAAYKEDLIKTSIHLKSVINTCYNDMMGTIEAINTYLKEHLNEDSKIPATLTYVKYNMINIFNNIAAYATAMLIRKISVFVYNYDQYNKLYSSVHNYISPDNLQLNESVINTDITDEGILDTIISNDKNALYPYMDAKISKTKMKLQSYISNKYDMEVLANVPVYEYPYKMIIKTISNIAGEAKEFLNNVINKREYITDDLISDDGLGADIIDKYGHLFDNIISMEYYLNNPNDENYPEGLLSAYTDISTFRDTFDNICRLMRKCYNYLNHVKSQYVNLKDKVEEYTYYEVINGFEGFIDSYKSYMIFVVRKLLERLDNFSLLIAGDYVIRANKITSESATDYSIESFIEEYTDIELSDKLFYESALKEYNVIRNKKDRGVNIIYEEVTDSNSNSSAPSVQTNTNEQHNEDKKKENTTSTTNNNGNENNENKESLVEKFKNWWKGIIEQFKKKSAKLAGNNDAWLARIKPKVLGLNTDKTSITVAKYENLTEQKINQDITAAINKINTINTSNIPAQLKSDKTSAQTYLFQNIPSEAGKDPSFGARVKHFFTFGKTTNANLSTYTGNDAKEKINEMVSYCENYKNMYTSISNNLDKLSNAAADKQTDIINSIGKKPQSTNESTIMEASPNEVKVDNKKQTGTDGSNDKIQISSVLTTVVRDYSGSILTVIEKKYLDYVKVLDKLAPSDESGKSDTENTDTETNEQDNTEK